MYLAVHPDLERKQRHHEADAELEQGREHMQPPQPSYAPQVLYRFPAGSPAPISDEEVAALAFPSGGHHLAVCLMLVAHFLLAIDISEYIHKYVKGELPLITTVWCGCLPHCRVQVSPLRS